MRNKRHPRPILATYTNGRGVFKKGKATTVARSITAAVRTLAEEPKFHCEVKITNPRGRLEAEIHATKSRITIIL